METFDKRYDVTIELERDDHMVEPWKECDGHGVVSEWTSRDKYLHERILCSDRSQHRFYDVRASIALALKDGWDHPPYQTGTKRERAARAVDADFEHLRAWCNGEWQWVGVIVKVSRDDHTIGEDSLWGIDDEKYAYEEGESMAQHIIDADLGQRRKAWRATLAAKRQARADLLQAICYG